MIALGLWTFGVPVLAVALARDRHGWIAAGAAALAAAVALGGANLVLGIRRLWAREQGAPGV